MNINTKNIFVKLMMASINKYNPDKYWRYREIVVTPNNMNKFLKFYMLYKIKKADYYNNASMGTDLNKGAFFESPPILPHGLNGIIISHFASIGKNVTIYQQVTIAGEGNKAAIIGNNCLIGAGAKIIGDVKIGNNVKIGANAVVVNDIPDNATVVGIPAKVVKISSGKK